MIKKIPLNKVKNLLDDLSGDYKVFAPVKNGRSIIFDEYRSDKEVNLEKFSVTSIKEALFPSHEAMIKYDYKKDPSDLSKTSLSLKSEVNFDKTVIFGVHPCDARGFFTFDKVYAGNGYRDVYYKTKRDATAIVAITCANPLATCFCTTVGGSPADSEGTDVLLTKVDEFYYAESYSEKGELLLKNSNFSSPQGGVDNEQVLKIKEEAVQKLDKNFSTEGIENKLLKIFSDSDYWKNATSKCLSCGICTYVCPTCYCFNITDEGVMGRGERIRSWDSCMFPLFTLEASGHNPRARKFERYRNRINHKFSYLVIRNNIIGCVGCGRCIRHCPVSLDIREVVKGVID
ncbi:MAG: 4Fe-4S dicluster domain-containing protein [Actinobacteria bacterium]|nr:4Fe-4S dicluster domain-containing protein [Actinomycetota bacterium]